jgi:hypothetical protein
VFVGRERVEGVGVGVSCCIGSWLWMRVKKIIIFCCLEGMGVIVVIGVETMDWIISVELLQNRREGITGGSGCGKGTLTNFLGVLGV